MDDHHFVATAVLMKSKRVLLCHRHPNRRWYPNVWDVPGGHIEIGESPVDAVRRELREELGVNIRVDDDEPFRTFQPAPDLTLHAWVVTEWTGNLINRAPDEHDQIGWFDLADLDGLDLADQSLKELVADAVELVSNRA